MHIEINNTKKE